MCLRRASKAGHLGPYSYDDHHAPGLSPAWRCAPDVNAAQYSWKLLILSISQTYAEEGDFVQVAKDGIALLYGYDIGNVLFKPTQAVEQPFRVTPQGALSYFVGNEAAGPVDGIPEDKGFAIAGGDTWSKVTGMVKSLVITWLAVALSFWLGSAQETCTDCDVPEESVLLQKSKEKDQGMPLWWYIYQANKKKKYDSGSEVTWRCAPDVNAAQYAWKNLILSISSTYAEEGDFVKVAADGIHQLYGYDIGPVLFKPTQAVEEPFRGTAEGALSYFVGAENLPPGVGIPEDKGFAIAGGDTWSKVRAHENTTSAEGNNVDRCGTILSWIFFSMGCLRLAVARSTVLMIQ
eukprot:Skav218591  [mRNA]  locus=scaffold3628:5646:10753:+ [translate_table: standard]